LRTFAGAGLEAAVSGELQVARMEEDLLTQRVREQTVFKLSIQYGAVTSAKKLEDR
jgi:hypothetical protein